MQCVSNNSVCIHDNSLAGLVSEQARRNLGTVLAGPSFEMGNLKYI